jgi:hypothetical protein
VLQDRLQGLEQALGDGGEMKGSISNLSSAELTAEVRARIAGIEESEMTETEIEDTEQDQIVDSVRALQELQELQKLQGNVEVSESVDEIRAAPQAVIKAVAQNRLEGLQRAFGGNRAEKEGIQEISLEDTKKAAAAQLKELRDEITETETDTLDDDDSALMFGGLLDDVEQDESKQSPVRIQSDSGSLNSPENFSNDLQHHQLDDDGAGSISSSDNVGVTHLDDDDSFGATETETTEY